MRHPLKLTALLLYLLVLVLVPAVQSKAQESAADKGSQGLDQPVDCPKPLGSTDAGLPGNGNAFEEDNIVARRNEWFYDQRAYPLGYIPAGARLNALSQLNQMLASRRALREQMALPDEPFANDFGTSWKLIGPQPIHVPYKPGAGGTLQVGPPYAAGRVTALAVNPMNPDNVYLGAAEGGVWETAEGGLNWQPLTDQQPSLAVGSIAIDPESCDKEKCNIIYVGTGEENFSYDSYYGAGILKSENGGATWTRYCGSLPNKDEGPFCGPFGTRDGGAYIGSLAVNPMKPEFLLAAVQFLDQTKSGIYRSRDGGKTWNPVKTGAYGTAVIFDPKAEMENLVYAALGTYSGNADNGVYESFDAGDNWSRLNGTMGDILPSGTSVGRIAMAISPANPYQLFVTMSKPRDPGKNTLLGFWSSPDAGVTWEKQTDIPNYCRAQCHYDNVIGASPASSSMVLVGGAGNVDDSGTRLNNVLLLGTVDPNGMIDWKDISTDRLGTTLHADLHAVAFSSDGKRFYVGTDGGAWQWRFDYAAYEFLNPTLAITQFYPGLSLGIGPRGEPFSLGGTQDNGVTSSPQGGGANIWNYDVCGDGGWTAISFTNWKNVFASCAGGSAVVNGVPLNSIVRRSRKGGAYGSWQLAIGSMAHHIDQTDRVNFIPPLVMDSRNSDTLYFGTCRAWRTINAGTAWDAASNDLTDCGIIKRVATISTIAVAPTDSEVVYAGSTNGCISMTNNVSGGVDTWHDRTKRPPLPFRAVTQITPDPLFRNTALVTYSGFSGFFGDVTGHVFRTEDGGLNWRDISGDPNVSPIPNVPVNDIVIDTGLCGTYYAATDVGVFYTADYGDRWQPLTDGLPYVVVLSLKLQPDARILRAATHGRSVWELSVPYNIPSGITLRPTTADFGDVEIGQTKLQVITLTNTCSKALTIDSIGLVDGKVFAFNTTCGRTLLAGASCKVNVSFAPTKTGDAKARLIVNDDGLGSPRTVALIGHGVR